MANLIIRGLSYFPVRLIICAFILSLVLFENELFLEKLEKQILSGLFHFFIIPSYYVGNNLFVGHIHSQIKVLLPIDTQIIFLVFFFSMAIVASISLSMRAHMLFYAFLCFLGFILTQFFIITSLLLLGFTDYRPYVQWEIIGTALTGGFFIEIMLFRIFTIPKPTKPIKLIRRSYIDEYVYLALVLAGCTLITYIFLNVLQVNSESSPAATYLALNLTNILALKYYVAYFIYEMKNPDWIRRLRHQALANAKSYLPISFLLPAFNEKMTITKCIESIDVAASNYLGKTEIVIVNDGSTDNTEQLATEALSKLKHSTGKLYTIPNSGQGFALSYGLQKSTGDIIFRIDTDSVIDKKAILPVMNHFQDPAVGSVSGVVFSIDESSIWQKSMTMLFCLFIFNKRGHALLDSIMTQPGAYSVFRKDALLKVGGWAKDQLGEDGEITLRLARSGYKNEFEEHSQVYSEAPKNFRELTEQRIRWGVGYFHARGRNLAIFREGTGPRKIIFLLNFVTNGMGFALGLYWPYFAAMLVSGHIHFSFLTLSAALGIPLSLVTIDILMSSLQYLQFIYLLRKFKKSYLIKYIPFMRMYHLILSILINPQSLEILLEWSSKYKDLNEKSYTILKKMIKKRDKVIKPN